MSVVVLDANGTSIAPDPPHPTWCISEAGHRGLCVAPCVADRPCCKRVGGVNERGDAGAVRWAEHEAKAEVVAVSRKPKITPTARTLGELRKRGATAQNVEQTIRLPGGRMFKRDLFGCIDIIVLTADARTLGIQATGDNAGDMGKRVRKIMDEPRMRRWLECGNLLEVWGWGRRGARGKRKLWTLRVERITLEMLNQHFVENVKYVKGENVEGFEQRSPLEAA